MPRTRVPNVRFLANADSPILPFLAPRVFTESPISSKSPEQDGAVTRTQNCETSKKTRGAVNGFRLPRDTHWHNREAKSTCSRTPSHGTKGTSSPRASVPAGPRHRLLFEAPTRAALDMRYVDMFNFASQQLRSYSTDTDRETNETSLDGRPHRSKRRIRISKSKAKSVSIRKVESTRHVTLRRVDAMPKRYNSIADRRRIQKLNLNTQRLDTFLSHLSDHTEKRLYRQGRYRTLRRRIYNLQRVRDGVVDMISGRTGIKALVSKAFASLDRKVYPGLRRTTCYLGIKHDPRCAEWSAKLFQGVGPHNQMQLHQNWMDLDEELRQACWPQILVYLLDRLPDRALHFVQLLACNPRVEGVWPPIIADSLEYLARHYVKQTSDGLSDSAASSFPPTFYHVFDSNLANYKYMCSQDLLMNVALLAGVEDLKRIWDLLVSNKTYLGWPTLLHFANAFGDKGEHAYALHCLRHIVQNGSNPAARQSLVSRKNFMWSCALVLRKSVKDGQNYHEATNIVGEFVKIGVQFDILLYNVIMHNAMEAGDYATAFRVYNNLAENGLKADKHTYSILLHGCTTTGDPAKFHDFAEHCAEMAIELEDPWLATDYLYYLHTRYDSEASSEQLNTILSHAYCRFFVPDALLGLATDHLGDQFRLAANNQDKGTPDQLFEPTTLALYIMIQTWVKLAHGINTTHVWQFYLHFRTLAREGPILAELAERPIVWNAFLLAFCQKQQFATASYVIKDLIDNGPEPNVYSFNIFAQAFFKTGQIQAAERVLEIMQSRNVSPDQYTYGILLRGYARGQRVERIGAIMDHLDESEQLDPEVLRLLARITDRNRLMLELEKSRLRKEKAAQEKIERGEARWGEPAFALLDSKAQSQQLRPEDTLAAVAAEPQFAPLNIASGQPLGLGTTAKKVDAADAPLEFKSLTPHSKFYRNMYYETRGK